MHSVLRSSVVSLALRRTVPSWRVSSASSLFARRPLHTHFTEEERLEHEDLILNDQSSNALIPPSSSPPTATVAASTSTSLPSTAAVRPPVPVASLHESAEARTQHLLHSAGLAHEPAPLRMYAKH